MEYKYVNEKNHLILLSLLKAYGIKRVIASPGATNITLVASMQHDPYFEMYSCVDERSAAYMACGMAEQTGEPVMLSCTGATSARDYMPGLTEAYYRKLPILTITSTQDVSKVGHLATQVFCVAFFNPECKCFFDIFQTIILPGVSTYLSSS